MRLPARLAAIAILAATVTSCSAVQPSPPAAPQAAAPAEAEPDCCATPLSEMRPVSNARDLAGPVTACLDSNTIEPVAEASQPRLPVTVTDAEGREVTVTDTSRILALDVSGTIAATVFALGLGDSVVGRDASTGFAGTGHLPVVTGASHTLNAEAILQLAPTVLLTDTTIGPKEVRQQLRDAGVTVVMMPRERRLDTVTALIRDVAQALGVPERGSALIDRVETELAAVTAEVARVAPTSTGERPRMLFLYVRGSANVYYIFGRDSGADSLVEAVGGIDVASEIGWEGMKPMTAEALVSAQPDVIVMMTAGLESMGGVDGLLQSLPAVAQTPAGEKRRIIDMDDSLILSFGPRSADVVAALAAATYTPGTGP